MKKILLFLVCLLLGVFIIDRLSYAFIKKKVFDKVVSGGSGGYINYLTQRKREVDFLVMGNSRARLHINPALLTHLYNGNGFNAGVIAVGDVFYNHVLLDMVLRDGMKPKAIILQVDATRFAKNDLEFELSAMLNYIGTNPILDKYIESFNYKDKLLLSSHLFRFNGKFLNLLYNYSKIASVGNDGNGFAPQTRVMDTVFEVLSPDTRKHVFLEQKVEALKNIRALCNSNNIRLYVVTTPSFRNNVFSAEDDRALEKILSAMPDIHYFPMDDIRKFPSLAGYENWADVNHMNEKGATIFSTLLNDSLAVYP